MTIVLSVFQCAGPVCDCKRNSDVRKLFKMESLNTTFCVTLSKTNGKKEKCRKFSSDTKIILYGTVNLFTDENLSYMLLIPKFKL